MWQWGVSMVNQIMKKDFKQKVYQDVDQVFYISFIPFDFIKDVELIEICEIIMRYGISCIPPSYHHIGEKLLKQAVSQIGAILEEFTEEWNRINCSIMTHA